MVKKFTNKLNELPATVDEQQGLIVWPDPKLFFVLEDMYAKNMYSQKVI